MQLHEEESKTDNIMDRLVEDTRIQRVSAIKAIYASYVSVSTRLLD